MAVRKLYECSYCGASFSRLESQVGNRAFCSRQCYAKFLRSVVPHNKGMSVTIEKPCLQCGTPIIGTPSEVKRKKYCGRTCAGESLKCDIGEIVHRCDIDSETDCWNWKGGLRGGYGRVKDPRTGKAVDAHRLSYEHHSGKIPDGLVIDHLCRNRKCINPDHLEVVTTAENIRRGNAGKGPRSEAHKAAIGKATRLRLSAPEARASQLAILDKARASPKRLENIRKALRTPEYKAKQSAATKRSWSIRKGLKNAHC